MLVSQCTPTCDLRPLHTPLARQHNTGLDHEVGLYDGLPFQTYGQYPVRARADLRIRLFL